MLPWKREWSFIWTKVNLLYQQGLSPFWVQSMIPYIYCTHVQLGPKTGLAPCAYKVVVPCTSFGYKTGCLICSKLKMAHWFLTDRRTRQAVLTFRNRWTENVLILWDFALHSLIDLKSKSSIFQRISDSVAGVGWGYISPPPPRRVLLWKKIIK